MPKPLRCGNCKSYITQQELEMRKPPGHPWPLTEDGARILRDNEQRGGPNPQCPECGNRTFVLDAPRSPTST
ncbi:MAG: hypothetical protein IPQ07_36430 [Myxococcales bacterium]|nr:hypothetical protein [Myxococcales bacterium]